MRTVLFLCTGNPARRLHLPFEDPGRARAAGGGDAEVLAVMRRVRTEMLWQLPEALRQHERTVPL
jgi:hypothetical protein